MSEHRQNCSLGLCYELGLLLRSCYDVTVIYKGGTKKKETNCPIARLSQLKTENHHTSISYQGTINTTPGMQYTVIFI